ncbi:hypothetical protein FSP39_009345 [Pinctada imbricata]|uniref:Cytochrome P450 n=1 Tax=Pinctada imbricata TaxID=66713 RepID=A0AA88Y4C7_PINIB|nr:hypothetical protein FSP39_009345 [Pinctada imbricata]
MHLNMETSVSVGDLSLYFAFVILTLAVVILINYGGNYPASFPPGPRGWPVVGNLLQVAKGDGLYGNLLKFRQEYGDVFRVQFGQQTWVFIAGHKAITETVLKMKTTEAGRPNWLYTVHTVLQGKGIIYSNGVLSAAARSFLFDALDEAKEHIEKSILANCTDIIRSIGEDPDSLSQRLTETEFATVLSLITGERFPTASDEYHRLRQLFDARNGGLTLGNPQNLFSWLNTFYRGKTDAALEAQAKLIKDLSDLLMTRMEQVDHRSECLIDSYANQLKQGKLKNIDKTHIFLTMLDLALASKDSLLAMVQWTLLNIANNADVQSKCRQELLKTILSDDKLWTCPAQLQPERFSNPGSSDVDGKEAKYGLGSRHCPGRTLAETFQYLVVSSIILEYEVENLTEDKSMDSYFKSVLRPKAFNLKFNKITN